MAGGTWPVRASFAQDSPRPQVQSGMVLSEFCKALQGLGRTQCYGTGSEPSRFLSSPALPLSGTQEEPWAITVPPGPSFPVGAMRVLAQVIPLTFTAPKQLQARWRNSHFRVEELEVTFSFSKIFLNIIAASSFNTNSGRHT